MNYADYHDAGLRIVPLYGINNDGYCDCLNPECKGAGKHPRLGSWSQVPAWSEDQMKAMEKAGFFDSGFGFVLDNHLIIDIDPRNGGDESYKELCNDLSINFEKESSFVVETGGGGQHIYFLRDVGLALVSHLTKYPGLDFKSSGYVVGAGSIHASGNAYEGDGDLESLTMAPRALVDLLLKPDTYRTRVDGEYIDVSEDQIKDMLWCIDNDSSVDYEEWIAIGMAIHSATQGAGFHLWECWSNKSPKHDLGGMQRKWHSFGKSSNPITIGSLIHKARQGGYAHKTTPSIEVHLPKDQEEENGLPCDINGIDLLRPPGFVGRVAEWINSQCRYSRENLAVAAAISTIGNIGGMRFSDSRDGVTGNTIFLCVAGSGTGKEAVQGAQLEMMRRAGLAPSVHGAIKSEQEMVRNLLRHQSSIYVLDEIGYMIKKLREGSADYIKGVIPLIMSAYTKANDFMLISGDLKEDVRKVLAYDLKAAQNKVDNNEDGDGRHKRAIDYILTEAMPSIDSGIKQPFLSMMGFTTPISFSDSVDAESIMNGFINRSFIIEERETNPKPKETTGFKKPKLPNDIAATLSFLYSSEFETIKGDTRRVCHVGERVPIGTTDEASNMLEHVMEWFWELGEQLKGENGFESLARRGFEMVAKVSFILSIPGGLREYEHVRWAFAFVKRDIEGKIRLASINLNAETKDPEEAGRVLIDKILTSLSEDGETISTICRRAGRNFSREEVQDALDMLTKCGKIKKNEHEWNGRKSVRYTEV